MWCQIFGISSTKPFIARHTLGQFMSSKIPMLRRRLILAWGDHGSVVPGPGRT
jgi:hypothetical protein